MERLKPHHHLIKCRKAFDKTQRPFTIKALERIGIQGTYLYIMRALQLKANIISMEKNSRDYSGLPRDRDGGSGELFKYRGSFRVPVLR